MKKYLLTVMAGMFALGMIAACSDIEDEPVDMEEPVGEQGETGLD